jgi:PAS domain-containing protein
MKFRENRFSKISPKMSKHVFTEKIPPGDSSCPCPCIVRFFTMAILFFPQSDTINLMESADAENHNHLWQLLWEYDPNGLIVVDANFHIKLVNPAFCRMFRVRSQDVIGEPAETILDDISDFRRVWDTGEVYRGKPREFS